MSFARLEASGLGKVYGRERALHGVSFTLAAGEAACLLGENGAGKSTLVSLLSTLGRPTTGSVRFDGASANGAVRGAIGLVAHESLCYGDLSARENLAFFAALHNMGNADALVAALLDRVGLAAAADRPARTFSRGMLQRLAVARALLPRPRLLLCDEPFTGLDRAGTRAVLDLLDEARAGGAIVLVVTHDLGPIAGFVTRALVLRRGRLVHDGPSPGTPDALLALYRRHVEGTTGPATTAPENAHESAP